MFRWIISWRSLNFMMDYFIHLNFAFKRYEQISLDTCLTEWICCFKPEGWTLFTGCQFKIHVQNLSFLHHKYTFTVNNDILRLGEIKPGWKLFKCVLLCTCFEMSKSSVKRHWLHNIFAPLTSILVCIAPPCCRDWVVMWLFWKMSTHWDHICCE